MTDPSTLAARLAYIASHGGAWEQRVCRGELDHAAIGETVPPSPQTERAAEGGDVMPSALSVARLARIAGRAFAHAMRECDDDLARAEAAAQAAADPLNAPLASLLDALQPLAHDLARQPRAAGSPADRFLATYAEYAQARRNVEANGG